MNRKALWGYDISYRTNPTRRTPMDWFGQSIGPRDVDDMSPFLVKPGFCHVCVMTWPMCGFDEREFAYKSERLGPFPEALACGGIIDDTRCRYRSDALSAIWLTRVQNGIYSMCANRVSFTHKATAFQMLKTFKMKPKKWHAL